MTRIAGWRRWDLFSHRAELRPGSHPSWAGREPSTRRGKGRETWADLCTLGDIAAEWLVFATGLTIAGKALYADFALDFAFAWLLGVIFQYFTIVPMRDIGRAKGIWAAIKADTLSILAFQVGLFLGMWIYQEVIFPPGLSKTTAAYWMLMQVSMVLGFFTAWPVNAWLVRAGLKEKM